MFSGKFKNKSVTIKAAWIMGSLTVLGAIIGGIFLLYSNSESSKAPIFSFKDTKDVAIYYNVPETATKETIKRFEEIEKRVNQTEDKVELTREEIRLLAQALKDLDQRTSGIEKLPDGRTKFGYMVSGTPSVVIQEHNTAATYFESGDYNSALVHSQNAIKAYEDSQKVDVGIIVGGALTQESVSKMYYLGALIAQRLGKDDLAYQYAKKALDTNPSLPINNAELASTLYNLGKYQEALGYIETALKDEPNNSEFLDLKKMILLKIGK